MLYEIFKFELKYRIRRPETYAFFVFLFLFSIVGVDFIFQDVEIGMMKKNAPLVIAKTMGAITGIFMVMTSMIMGVPILRDFQYNITSLLFVNPITKKDYLLGRFVGSFVVLLFIFSAIPMGMMVGEFLPWHHPNEMLPFNSTTYLQSFAVVVVPILFFGASLFFVTGMLSKKLLVVYTQGVILFVVFLLTKAITNETVQAILDPFSLTTLTQVAKNWSITDRNSLAISMTGIMFFNKLFWSALGVVSLTVGFSVFKFKDLLNDVKKGKEKSDSFDKSIWNVGFNMPAVTIQYNLKTQCIQLLELSKFYTKSLLKETSFWAIAICGIIIIIINSVNLGTVYGVDSYPATYFIVEELQEMSLYFFIIILVFYSGELIWKERNVQSHLLYDSTPVSDTIALVSKYIALINIYIILMLSLIITGMVFQAASGYYSFELKVYFSGFFLEILPFLVLYTVVAFFFQVVSNNKFVGVLLVLLFFIINVTSEFIGVEHSLLKYGGRTLGTYSDMNGYGHFLKPYLWIKGYWLIFGFIVLLISSILSVRGTETKLKKRINTARYRLTKPLAKVVISASIVFAMVGGYVFYNTNILNEYWTHSKQITFRADYEKTLKSFEYFPQPKITTVNLNIELYPTTRSYSVDGYYMLKNTLDTPMDQIHIQKRIASHVQLEEVIFEGGATKNLKYEQFDYTIYQLAQALQPGDSIKMSFKQSFSPKGFEDQDFDTQMVYNGTFFTNEEFPTIGYNRKYELRDAYDRKKYGLEPRFNKAEREDVNELKNARSGGDSDGILFEAVIGTHRDQIAIAPGRLQKQWIKNNRNYYHYAMNQSMINFYSIVSANYEIKTDLWQSTSDTSVIPIALEIYYHTTHKYNLERMIASMKASLAYYSANLSPYQYQQLRIMEFPRYEKYAQSFPNTIPFSEAIGFVLDIDEEKDVDMAFYVTAHEVAHQWFGMQIEAANVKGQHMILETLSQYAALMVLKNNFSEEKVQQFLEFQEESYTKNRKKSKTKEPPLALVENQDYIYYDKGAITMYMLQQEIGEDKVNLALQRFIKDWNSTNGTIKTKVDRYATTKDLLLYLKEVTPDSLAYLIKGLFETVTPLNLKKQ